MPSQILNVRPSDPLEAFQFAVEIDGLLVGGFSEVSGIQSETSVYSYREGGENGFTCVFPDAATQSRLVLKRGLTLSDALWNWYQAVLNGNFERKTVHLLLNSRDGGIARIWGFTEAFPVKWSGPELRAAQSEIAVETVELVYHQVLAGIGS